MTEFEKTVDYIVVGAGSAGCVLTHRLSENGDNRVLTLEAGDRDKSFMIHMPLGVGQVQSEQLRLGPISHQTDIQVIAGEARAQIAFYYTTRLYHTVLDVHGWREVGEEIATAFRKGDFKAMSDAVPDELVDEIVLLVNRYVQRAPVGVDGEA